MYRNKDGSYQKDDWTSVGDVGRIYEGDAFTYNMYLLFENAYISAIRTVMKLNNIKSFNLQSLEKKEVYDYPDISKNNTIDYISGLSEGYTINYRNIDFIAKLILRELLWGKFVNKNMFVHFGYDYYMYIGSRKDLGVESKIISEMGLFVEEMESPYL